MIPIRTVKTTLHEVKSLQHWYSCCGAIGLIETALAQPMKEIAVET